MARLNAPPKPSTFTHEGAPAKRIPPLAQLRRSVCSCLLWEKEFYEDGQAIADRITDLARQVKVEDLAALAVEVRSVHNLRHVPLLLTAVLVERGAGNRVVQDTIAAVVQRADELGEFLAIYARLNGRSLQAIRPLSAQVKKGLARAFHQFDAYQLAKYNRTVDITLRDVLRLTHPSPDTKAEAENWGGVVAGTLAAPDTWEVALSGGADKRETFERLIRDRKLGYLALLRNLRNMAEAGVDRDLVSQAIVARRGARRVLPFRYVAAAQACPQFEPALDKALVASLEEVVPLDGLTILLVDVSGSMTWAPMSQRSKLNRMDAAATLASMWPGDRRVFSFSNRTVEVPPRLGMAGVDAIKTSQGHGGTMLGQAIRDVNALPHDRLIVITDEQSHDRVPDPTATHGYVINVASARNGVGYGRWTHIDGFSEHTLRFIREHEAQKAKAG